MKEKKRKDKKTNKNIMFVIWQKLTQRRIIWTKPDERGRNKRSDMVNRKTLSLYLYQGKKQTNNKIVCRKGKRKRE